MKAGFDTLSYSGEAYQALADNTSISEGDQIKNLIIGYLASEKAYVRSPEAYTRATAFVEAKAIASKTVVYRESESEYLKELNNLMGWTISKDNLSFSDFDVAVDKDAAQASIVEDYKYFIDDGFDGESFRHREYTFRLSKDSGSWQIVEIKTNDPWETEENFSYAEIDVAGVIAQQRTETFLLIFSYITPL